MTSIRQAVRQILPFMGSLGVSYQKEQKPKMEQAIEYAVTRGKKGDLGTAVEVFADLRRQVGYEHRRQSPSEPEVPLSEGEQLIVDVFEKATHDLDVKEGRIRPRTSKEG